MITQRTVSINLSIVEEIEKLQTSYTFSEFCQMAIREAIDRKKRDLGHLDLSHKHIAQLTLQQIQAQNTQP